MSGAFDPTGAARFIEDLYPADVTGMLSVGHIDPINEMLRSEPFSRHPLSALLDYAAMLDAQGTHSIYLRNCTVLPGTKGRGTAADSVELPGLAGDIDIGAIGHTAKNNPPDEESARKIVQVSDLPEPTIWVHSGGGLYPNAAKLGTRP
jgi:hypothetical protein